MENKTIRVDEINVLALAYMGDAVIDLHVRKALIKSGLVLPKRLHHRAVNYVSAKSQAAFLQYLLNEKYLEPEEEKVVRRGRNAKSGTIPKHTDVITYRYSTALEALFGYLYFLERHERIKSLINKMFELKPLKGGQNIEG
ncbi:ribonuclease-3 family protein [Scopulibacillus daqui]|uniref:Mini-ribonuclease 3 n=1 Tax=Scopulibacillus daqui TaxID=1469162 RepID=A0ABS2Q369_9BACL|nr:ribonuclease III domain-containing protein [Scopulibacillus daqui]MBM7646741.1 ribonuclease-3 family protein [Scopulibacillus daqui]